MQTWREAFEEDLLACDEWLRDADATDPVSDDARVRLLAMRVVVLRQRAKLLELIDRTCGRCGERLDEAGFCSACGWVKAA